ncbi:SKP1-like protein 1A [Telopea speciosissima]|uniref:SKP1-like protein 1A n=1 Tax=Telopea speciosissima TaxID=54955 RepID=UPI001CC77375|nr:SKP1-like protein 1A [Telopea speciosissima]
MSSAKVFLKSSDGETFEVDESVVCVSEILKNMIEDGCVDDTITLPNVRSRILPKVIEYCKKQVTTDNGSSKKKMKTTINCDGDGDEKGKKALPWEDDGVDFGKRKAEVEELKKWEAEYLDIDQQVLYELMTAANYLDIKGLLDMTAEKVASMIRERTPEQIREVFNIKNDFTPEEEEEIRKENSWAFY